MLQPFFKCSLIADIHIILQLLGIQLFNDAFAITVYFLPDHRKNLGFQMLHLVLLLSIETVHFLINIQQNPVILRILELTLFKGCL